MKVLHPPQLVDVVFCHLFVLLQLLSLALGSFLVLSRIRIKLFKLDLCLISPFVPFPSYVVPFHMVCVTLCMKIINNQWSYPFMMNELKLIFSLYAGCVCRIMLQGLS